MAPQTGGILDDIREFLPPGPLQGPPFPTILHMVWPQGVKELFDKLPGSGKRYAALEMRSRGKGPLEAIDEAWKRLTSSR